MFCLGALMLFATSCKTPKNITYFQDASHGYSVVAAPALNIKVKPGDKVSINVNTQDAALSQLFNVNTQGVKVTNVGSGGGDLGGGYLVDEFGDIKYPLLGKVNVGGKTRNEISDYIERELKSRNIIKDAIVNVDFADLGFITIGEGSAGRHPITKDKMNIIEAIAESGNIPVDASRTNILVIREGENGKSETYRVDLTNLDKLTKSPVYWIQQNDVIYAEPTQRSLRQQTLYGEQVYQPYFWTSLVSVVFSLVTMGITLSNLSK